MGKNQDLQLPATPTYQSNPTFKQGYQGLADYGNRLTTGDLTGNLSWLQPTVNPNNSAQALSAAQGLLHPQFRDTLNQITQSAANNNQLNSSTFTDALARSQSDLNSQYQSIVSQQAINDSNQANSNRLGLLGKGLDTLQSGTSFAGQDQNSENSFNLENYQNQVAKAIQDNQNANNANGWQQALGLVSPIGHDYLQSQGINQVPGYGVGQTLGFASTIMGAGGFGGGGQAGLQNQLQMPSNQWNLNTPVANANRFSSAPFAGAYASN